LDETNWLENDDVFRYKSGLLKQHNIAIWRNHDYIHRHQPDRVMSDVVERLGWSANFNPANSVVQTSPMSLKNLIAHAKSKLGIDTVRYIGDLSQDCSKILVMPGAAGGRRQILSMSKEKPDVLVCGEIAEWETAEYVRDARTKGDKLSFRAGTYYQRRTRIGLYGAVDTKKISCDKGHSCSGGEFDGVFMTALLMFFEPQLVPNLLRDRT
jgi:hypothetical protein